MPTDSRPRLNLVPSLGDVIFCTILFSLLLPGSGLLGDGDTGYHIRAGEHILKTWSIPRVDIFSLHTPPLPWTAHEWLSEVIMAVVHGFSGLTGVVVFFSILLALSAALLFRILKAQETAPLVAAAVTVLASAASQIHWLARPHVFSFLFMLTWHRLLESWQKGDGNRLYLLPVSMLFWVNLHGGFLGGYLLMGAYLTGNLCALVSQAASERTRQLEKIRQLALTIAACLLACLCNPQGVRILAFPFRLVSDNYLMDHVSEFLSPNFHQILPFKYLLLLLIALPALSSKSLSTTDVILVLIFTNMALYSARYIPLFAMVTAPILTRQWNLTRPATGGRLVEVLRRRADNIARMDAQATGYLWPAAALLLVMAATGSGRLQHGFDPKIKAVAAAEFLMRERIAGNMFNNDEFGDYLIYRGFPVYRVFFDGRSDMYGADKLKEYCQVTAFEPGWENIFQKYRITWVFYDTNSSFSRFLQSQKTWVLIYSDKVASIFVKDLPQYQYLLSNLKIALLFSSSYKAAIWPVVGTSSKPRCFALRLRFCRSRDWYRSS